MSPVSSHGFKQIPLTHGDASEQQKGTDAVRSGLLEQLPANCLSCRRKFAGLKSGCPVCPKKWLFGPQAKPLSACNQINFCTIPFKHLYGKVSDYSLCMKHIIFNRVSRGTMVTFGQINRLKGINWAGSFFVFLKVAPPFSAVFPVHSLSGSGGCCDVEPTLAQARSTDRAEAD